MRTNQSVPFFRDADANPWASGNGIVNRAGNDVDVLDEPAGDPPANDPPANTPPPADPPATDPPAADPPATTPPADPPATVDPPKDWRETVTNDDLLSEATKKLDRKALLKAAGVDDETILAIDYKQANGGNWNEYLRVKNTDYKTLSPQQLIEMDLREKYAGLDNSKFAFVLNNELKKYNLNRETFTAESEEAILGEIMLDRDSESIRAKYIEKQNGLKAPEPAPDTTAQARELAQQQITANIRNSEAVKNLTTSKLIPFGAGEEAFNYEVKDEVGTLVDATIKAAHQGGRALGEGEITQMFRTLSFHINPDGVIKALVEHGKTLGVRSVRKDAANTSDNSSTTTTDIKTLTDAELLAQSGKVVNNSG